ncbi:MAG: hypothetical protein ACK5LJ_16705 [Paracoccus sp. (in: a-proteobacteria)]
MMDYVAVSGTREGRVIEFVDHLHEQFTDPCIVRNGAYITPAQPGFSIRIKDDTLSRFDHSG